MTDPPSQRAIAQLGATDAWARNGRVNSAVSVRVAGPAASVPGWSTTVWACDGAASKNPRRSRASGSDGLVRHRAARATRPAARSAARSVSATTPRNEPSRTSTVSRPRSRSASPVRSAARAGGRTTRP